MEEEYKKIMRELATSPTAPMVWTANMFAPCKEYLKEDEEGDLTFRGAKVYFVNELDGSLIDWRTLNV